jgi:hypothetical protein
MYGQFLALRENPVNVNPDPRFLFRNRYSVSVTTTPSFHGPAHTPMPIVA